MIAFLYFVAELTTPRTFVVCLRNARDFARETDMAAPLKRAAAQMAESSVKEEEGKEESKSRRNAVGQ